MAKTRDEKQKIINEIAEKLQKSRAVVFADYQGLTMSQFNQLRDQLREQSAEFTVTKNTLLNLSLKEAHLQTKDDVLEAGPTATLFAYDDEVTPLKTLVKMLKEANIGRIKAGFLGQSYLTGEEVTRLANLPGKQELQAKVVGIVAAPLYGIVNVLQGNIRNLVYALEQIRKQKGGETISS